MVGASIILQMLRRGAGPRGSLLPRDGEPALAVGEVRPLARRILRFTLVTEGIGAVLPALRFWQAYDLWPAHALWHGVFYSVSAFCNAGFDLNGAFLSLQPFREDAWTNVVIAGLIQLGRCPTWSYTKWRNDVVGPGSRSTRNSFCSATAFWWWWERSCSWRWSGANRSRIAHLGPA